jgi:hypothetical protein
MSEVTELAEAEAARAEAESPDEPTPEPSPDEQAEEEEAHESEQVEGVPAEPEPQEEPSGAAGAVGDKEIEKMLKRVETANAGYARKLGEILGDEAQILETCPRCAAPFLGLIWPAAMRPVSPEVKDAVLVSVGEQPAMATMPDPYARRCDVCDGSGVTASGSRRPEEKGVKCIPCNGRGWIPVGDERRVGRSDIAPVAQANGQTDVSPQSMTATAPAPDEDLWGRRAGDPNYGVHPMYVASR